MGFGEREGSRCLCTGCRAGLSFIGLKALFVRCCISDGRTEKQKCRLFAGQTKKAGPAALKTLSNPEFLLFGWGYVPQTTPLKSCCQATLQARSVVCSVQKAWCLAGHGQHLRALYVRRGVRSASCFVITFQDVALLRGLWVRKG